MMLLWYYGVLLIFMISNLTRVLLRFLKSGLLICLWWSYWSCLLTGIWHCAGPFSVKPNQMWPHHLVKERRLTHNKKKSL